MLTYLSLARRYRPRWLVWENVPGVLSADKGQAFGSLLGGLAELGYGFAYRVLDAQYFGLAQRRKRVFVVGHLGDWRRAAAVLFERESLSGHPAPRREAGEVVTGTLTSCSDTSRKHGHGWGQQELTNGFAVPVAGTLGSNHGNVRADHAWTGQLIAGPGGDDLSHALSSRDAKGPCSYLAQGTLIAHALRAEGFDASEDCSGRGTPLVPVAFHNRQDPDVSGDVTHQIGAKDNGMAVAQAMQVRRLTPRECERLQGFPDDYTLIPYRGKPAADGPRYKALGNSMAVPVVHWIGQRIAFVDTV
jgi:DNA (cytosine-5)-methyltransferase 1